MEKVGETQDSKQAGSWLILLMGVDQCGMASGEGFIALLQDLAKLQKQKQKQREVCSWNIKLQTLKAGLSFTKVLRKQYPLPEQGTSCA